MVLERRSLGQPDEVHRVGRGRIETVSLSGLGLGRAILEPGWRWSEDVRPIAGTDSCQGTHRAYVVSGRMHVRMDDGSELDLAPGDAHVVGPGHDAWVVGDEPLLIIDVLSPEPSDTASAGSPDGAQSVACPCGVSFSVASSDGFEHLVDAVQEHALHTHGHSFTRDQVVAEIRRAPSLSPAG